MSHLSGRRVRTLPRSPTKMRKSPSGQSCNVSSTHTSPAPVRTNFLSCLGNGGAPWPCPWRCCGWGAWGCGGFHPPPPPLPPPPVPAPVVSLLCHAPANGFHVILDDGATDDVEAYGATAAEEEEDDEEDEDEDEDSVAE